MSTSVSGNCETDVNIRFVIFLFFYETDVDIRFRKLWNGCRHLFHYFFCFFFTKRISTFVSLFFFLLFSLFFLLFLTKRMLTSVSLFYFFLLFFCVWVLREVAVKLVGASEMRVLCDSWMLKCVLHVTWGKCSVLQCVNVSEESEVCAVCGVVYARENEGVRG